MRGFFILLSLVGVAASTQSLASKVIEGIDENLLKLYFPPGKAAGNCADLQFNHCQSVFDTSLGFDPTLTWRNGQQLEQLIHNLLDGSVHTFLKVCAARTQISQCLGTAFNSCINRFSLMNRPNADYKNVLYYTETFYHLDFVCNSGFEILSDPSNFATIVTKGNGAAGQACITAFQTSLQNNPNSYCASADTFTKCYKAIFTPINNQVAWAVCEDIRVGFAYDCPNIRCTVN
uniref:DUF19 domain-containing protein n=2 Tax=Rhabditophanes sp. KR3021 TaxID=114890 RepID=A0AC35UAQ5_9BILA